MEPFITPAYAQAAEAVSTAVKAGDSLLGMGPFGAILVLLLIAGAGAVWVLIGWVKDRDRAIAARDEVIRQLQDKRAEEAKEWAERVAVVATTSSAALAATTSSLEKLSGDLDVISDHTRLSASAVDALARLLDQNGRKLDDLISLITRGGLNRAG